MLQSENAAQSARHHESPGQPGGGRREHPGAGAGQTARGSPTGQPLTTPSLLGKAAREFASTPMPVVLASFLINLLALALPLTLQQIYDRILPNAAVETLTALLIGLFTVVVIDIALRILRDNLITDGAIDKAFRGRVLAFATLLKAEPRRVRERSSRYWLDRMSAVEDLASVKENADKALFIDMPFVFIFLGMVALIGGWLVLAPIVLIGLFSVTMLWMARRQRILMEERREDDEKRYAQVMEWLSGIGTIKLLAMETQIYRRFEAMLSRGVALSYHAVLQNNRLPMLGQLFSNLMMVVVSTVGAVAVIEGTMSIGSLACCSLLATRVAQPVFRVVSIAAQMRSTALVEARAGAVYGLPLKPPVQEAPPRIEGRIELAGATLPAGGRWSDIHAIDLVLEPGAIVGIAGPPGSGKTALLSMVDGTLAPAGGRVLIDGRDATQMDALGLRRSIQRIDGRVAIFRGTILENVAMFRTGVHIAEAVTALEAVGLDSQISKLPEGYDTPIGDGAAIVLPYGFQQALMIARALAQQPAVLLVSQIGALLDIDNYRRLERALRNIPRRPTTLLVSQRGSIFSIAERVYEIRGGELYLLGQVNAPGPAGTGAPQSEPGQSEPGAGGQQGLKQA